MELGGSTLGSRQLWSVWPREGMFNSCPGLPFVYGLCPDVVSLMAPVTVMFPGAEGGSHEVVAPEPLQGSGLLVGGGGPY